MNKIFKTAIVVFIITFMSIAAYAEDPTDNDSPANWTGFDLGVFAAFSSNDIDEHILLMPDYNISPNFDGTSLGVLLGYNYQLKNRVVLGIEADLGAGHIHESPASTGINDFSEFDVEWNSHVRAKVGYAFDSVLPYVAGGLAIEELKLTDTDPGSGNVSHVLTGWTVGCGIEYQITKHLSTRLEYLYDDFGTKKYKMSNGFPGVYYLSRLAMTSQTIRVGLSYSF